MNVIDIIFYVTERVGEQYRYHVLCNGKGGEHHRYHIFCNGKGGEHHRYHVLCNGNGVNIIDIIFVVMEMG